VLFRSSDLQVAFGMYEQMVVAVKTTFSGDIVALYQHIDRTVDRWVLINLVLMLLIVWGVPSTRRLFARHWTALDQRTSSSEKTAPDLLPWLRHQAFGLTPRWAIIMAAMLCSALIFMSGTSRFIYYQF
jgi:hypothetical protein